MNNPPHPGRTIRDDCITAYGLSVTDAADKLGVIRQTLSNPVNEKSAISPEMAQRFEKFGWAKSDHWLRLQMNYDLAQVRARADEIHVQSPEL